MSSRYESEKWVDISWLTKWMPGLLAVCAFVALVVLAVFIPMKAGTKFSRTITTNYYQAVTAPSPEEFSANMLALDKALTDAGMVTGNGSPFNYPQSDMVFVHKRIGQLVTEANALSDLSITDVGRQIGLSRLQASIYSGYAENRFTIPVMGYWMWQQGGVWWLVGPLAGCFSLAVTFLVLACVLPAEVRRKVVVTTAGA